MFARLSGLTQLNELTLNGLMVDGTTTITTDRSGEVPVMPFTSVKVLSLVSIALAGAESSGVNLFRFLSDVFPSLYKLRVWFDKKVNKKPSDYTMCLSFIHSPPFRSPFPRKL